MAAMDDFANILHRDYGLKPQGKSAPMTSSKPAGPSPFSSSSPSSTPASIQSTSSGGKPKNGSNRNSRSSTPILGESLDEDFFFGSLNGINSSSSGRNTFGSAAPDMPAMYDDVFGGPPKFASPSYPPMPSSGTQQTSSSQSYDDIFRIPVKPSSSTSSSSNKGSSFPVFDVPLYDDDIFGGVPGIRSGSVVYDDVFSGGSTVGTSPSVLEDILGVSENRDRPSGSQQPVFDSSIPSAGLSDFDDLIPGFGGTEPAKPRSAGGGKLSQNNSSGLEKDSFGMPPSNPFDVLQGDGPFNVPQSADQPSTFPFSDSDASKVPAQSLGSHHRRYSNSDFDENIDASGNSSPHISTGQSPLRESRYPSKSKHSSLNSGQTTYASVSEENHSKRNQSSSSQADEQTRSSSSPKPRYVERTESPSFHSPMRRNRQMYDDVEDPVRVPKVVENRQADEFWISVEDVKLVTEPTAAPPPSRRPPLPGLKHGHTARRAAGSKVESNQRPTSRHESPQSAKLSSSRGASEHSNRSNFNDSGNIYAELEDFASGISRARKETKMDMSAPTLEEEIMEGSAAAAASAMAMKEAMERARSKLRDRGKEERESGLKVEETQDELNEAKEDKEEKAREQEEKERAHEREEREREREAKAIREREERHREREEIERKREREKDRIAVERATQEARERAERVAVERVNAEARERAAAEAKQRVAVERVTAEARERAAAEARERAAVERAMAERAAAEARERAAAEAREKAAAEARERAAAERASVERATAEARERAAAEAREKAAAERATSEARTRAERVFVERVNAEARERAAEKAAADARERAERAAAEKASAEKASAAREQQRRSENDLETFFASNSRPGSAPRQRSPAKGSSSQPSKGFATEGSQRNSTGASALRKVTPTTSADDWTSLFGPAVPAAGEFPEVEGESTERRRARLDRHQRTAERAAKALDEKNQRDLQAQREQAERHRAGDMLDAEIKRWAAGKEGNLRALLSTLQYVLWPECGWQAVSLTDLITAAAVKKVYRKATLCVHPDKVQQKGATIQQKYIAEKVFDLLKEAWNKFNSEELF